MTFFKTITFEPEVRREIFDNDTLEGVAIMLKRTRNRIDSLSEQYDSAEERILEIKEQQKEASALYKKLKEKLIKLAEEDLEDDKKGNSKTK